MPASKTVGSTFDARVVWTPDGSAAPASVAWSVANADATITPDPADPNHATGTCVNADPGLAVEAVATLTDGTTVNATPDTLTITLAQPTGGTVTVS